MIDNRAKRLESLRTSAFMPFSFCAVAGFGLVAMVGLIQADYASLALGLVAMLATIINLFTYFNNTSNSAPFVRLVLFAGVFFVGTVYLDTASAIGTHWLMLFPILSFLFIDIKKALVLNVFYISSIIPVFALRETIGLELATGDVLTALLGVVLVSLFMGYYDRALGVVAIDEKKKRLEQTDSSKALKLEIAHRQNAEAQMGEALKKLEENNKQLEQVTAIDEATISSIGEAVLIVHPDGKIIRANPSAGRVLGLNQEELLGETIVKSLTFMPQHNEDVVLPEHDIVIAKSMEHRSIDAETYRIVRPDGSILFAQMTASPLVVGGVVYGAVVVIRDVTQEVVVDKAKSEFVSIASHQLRTPLSTINWYLEMVLAGDFGAVNDEQREFIQEAYGASKRMGDLINALLNASRIDVGAVAVEPEPNVDIRDVLKGVLTDLESKVVEKKMHIDVSIDNSVVPTLLDPRIMEIIFLNLISNAVKYSPESSQVTVSATCDDAHMIISVSDHGFGIPEEVQSKIFTKMFRADNAVEHEPDGNGLGLYIIKSILETINGSIAFVSKENEGTTFTVRLPKEGMEPRAGAKQLNVSINV